VKKGGSNLNLLCQFTVVLRFFVQSHTKVGPKGLVAATTSLQTNLSKYSA